MTTSSKPLGGDTEFETCYIDRVSEEGKGWALHRSDGWDFFVRNDNCDVAPQPGEAATFYGRGIGYEVRGLVIGGRVYFYQSPADYALMCAARSAKYEREEEERRAAFLASLPTQPAIPCFAMTEAGSCKWLSLVKSNSTDPYSYACVRYAATWANAMDAAIGRGETVEQCSERLSHEVDTDGITGAMYGFAVAMLSECWEHGESLRRWHNRSTQIGDEGDRANENGGVINPAMLSVGS